MVIGRFMLVDSLPLEVGTNGNPVAHIVGCLTHRVIIFGRYAWRKNCAMIKRMVVSFSEVCALQERHDIYFMLVRQRKMALCAMRHSFSLCLLYTSPSPRD